MLCIFFTRHLPTKLTLGGFFVLATAQHTIKSDVHWFDTDGNRIEAHAAGMLQSPVDDRWYWYGESKKTPDLSDHGVNCYSSESIAGPWQFEGRVFTQDQIKQPDKPGPFIVERPKVLYNTQTAKYVMWFHLDVDGYGYRSVGVAQSSFPAGPFEYVHGFRPDGKKSLDMSLFRDPVDGQAYFIRSVDNEYNAISRLSSDYLNSSGMISWHSPVFEGMALFRHPNGTYYMMTSHLTGWNPNPLMLFRAEGKSLDDPLWVDMGNPTQSSTSFNSQPTYVVQYSPKNGTPYFVYMGDDWLHCKNQDGSRGPLINACYTWLPIKFDADSVRINWCDVWDLEKPWVCPTPSPPPDLPPLSRCALTASPKRGGKLALVDCKAGGVPGQQWHFTGRFDTYIWKPLNQSSTCKAGSHRAKMTEDLLGYTLETCQAACRRNEGCRAIHFLKETGRCIILDSACPHPNSEAADVASYEVSNVHQGAAGLLQLAELQLCVDTSSGMALLSDCGNSPGQTFVPSGPRLKRQSDEKCLDVQWCGGRACDGLPVEAWDCNSDHPNQQFALLESTRQIISRATGEDLCLSVCEDEEEKQEKEVVV